MAQEPIVKIHQGDLLGKIVKHCRGGYYYSFQGIPYGEAPVGERRFKSALPAKPWTGVRDATSEGDQCFSRHMVFQYFAGSENCLFLNVYTPELPKNNKHLKPVMVWIHGGGFYVGSGNSEFFSPDFFMTEDVIIITINYRLGILGFLNMKDPTLEVPGNAALKDQVLALKWVQQNITYFGGDPNNVTVFGESAGAASTHYLMLSPMAKGLFHRVIIQSGSALCSWAKGQPTAPLVAKALNLNTTNEKEILKILQEMPVEELLKLQDRIRDNLQASNLRPICPVVETATDENTFLPDEPINLIKSGKYSEVPILIGYTSREGILMELVSLAKHSKLKVNPNFEGEIPHVLNVPKGSEMSKTIAKKIEHFYYGEETPSDSNMEAYYTFQTDNLFLKAIYDTIRHHNASSSAPIYFYRMSVESSLGILKKLLQVKSPGVCHGEDICYLFKNAATPDIRSGSLEDITIRRFTKLWTTFARHGNPNPLKKDPLINVTWEPTQEGQLHFLDIGENLTVGINPEAGRIAFWDEIYCLSPATSKL